MPHSYRIRSSTGNETAEAELAEWHTVLHDLYHAFASEDDRTAPPHIVPFHGDQIVRFLLEDKEGPDDFYRPCGMASLAICPHGTGAHFVAHVEDVFVDSSRRGNKYGEKLMQALIDYAKSRGDIIRLELTSSTKRVAARSLYEKLGFTCVASAEDGGTNLYRLPLL